MNHFCLTIISSLETMLIPFMLEIFFHSHSQALETYGTLTGMALPFLFFPATIVNSLSVMLMPAISSAYDQKQHRQMENTISASLHIFRSMSIYECRTDNFEYFKWIWKDEADSLPKPFRGRHPNFLYPASYSI